MLLTGVGIKRMFMRAFLIFVYACLIEKGV